jgi:hypothetical protein
MSTEGETLQVSVLPYRCLICPPLVTRQMSNLAVLANSNTQNAFLFPVHAMFSHNCPLSGETCKYATAPNTQKETWRDSLPIAMLLSAVSVLVVVQPSSEVPEGLMDYPVFVCVCVCVCVYIYIYIHTHTHTQHTCMHVCVRVCLGCCTAEFGSSGGTYELLCICMCVCVCARVRAACTY